MEGNLSGSEQEIKAMVHLEITTMTRTVNRDTIVSAAPVVMIKLKKREHPAQKSYLLFETNKDQGSMLLTLTL
jgi:hypothetical protein